MSKKRYWLYNFLIFLVYTGFYLYPALYAENWAASAVKGVSPFIIIGFVALIHAGLAYILLTKQSAVLRVLKKVLRPLTKKRTWIIIFIISFLFFFLLAVKRHLNLNTALYDFGLEEQVVWNTSQGRFFQAGVEVNNYLGDHFSLLTLIPSLIYVFFASPFVLIFIQIACVILAAVAVKKIADRELKSPGLSLLIYLIYLFYIGLTGLLLGDYRPVVLSLPLLAWGIYFLEDPKKQKLSIILLIIAALGKEDMAVFVGTLGLYLYFMQKKKYGLWLAVYGYALFIISMFVIIPHFRGAESDTLSRVAGFGSMFEMLGTKFTYIIRLFFPVLFLPFLKWKKLWVLIPSICMNLITNYSGQLSALNQYDIATGLVIFWSLIGAFSLIRKKKKSLYYWVVLLVIVNILLLTGHNARRYLFTPFDRYSDYTFIQDLKQKIPDDAVVATTEHPGGQFGQRQGLQLFDDTVKVYSKEPDYIVIDKIQDWTETTQRMYQDSLSNGYMLRDETSGLIILQKVYFSF